MVFLLKEADIQRRRRPTMRSRNTMDFPCIFGVRKFYFYSFIFSWQIAISALYTVDLYLCWIVYLILNVKIKSSHGGHLEFPISKRFTWRFLKFRPISIHYGSWQPCWISTFKILSCDPDLHPRWPPSADIVLT
jgi:hypothetical protein